MVKIAIGEGSCRALVELDQIPKVGEMIVIPDDQVLGAEGIGMVLVGRPIIVTARAKDIEVEGEMVPHIYAQTEGFPDSRG